MRVSLTRAPRPYEDYYCGRVGGSAPEFVGTRRRDRRGLGLILRRLGGTLRHLFKKKKKLRGGSFKTKCFDHALPFSSRP
jgi:hypothetical protein